MTTAQRILTGASLVIVAAFSTLAYTWLAYDTQAIVGGGVMLAGLFVVGIGAWNKVF